MGIKKSDFAGKRFVKNMEQKKHFLLYFPFSKMSIEEMCVGGGGYKLNQNKSINILVYIAERGSTVI